jgi:hypothetical protein
MDRRSTPPNEPLEPARNTPVNEPRVSSKTTPVGEARVSSRTTPLSEPRVSSRTTPISEARISSRTTPLSEPRVSIRTTPINEPRISSRITPASRLTPEEIQQTISDVKEEAAKEMARLSRPLPAMVNWRKRPLTVVAFTAVAVAVWALQLAALRPPQRELGERERDAGLRYAIALQVARVEAFRARHKRIPAAQSELSELFAGMSYAKIDTIRYAITGIDGPLTLRYRSDSSMQTFLGSSLLSIRDRRKP